MLRKGLIALCNRQLEAMFGYGRDELIGQPVELLVPPKQRAQHTALRAAYSEAPTTRAMGAGRNLHGIRKDGSEFPIEIGLNALPDQTVLATVIDRTYQDLLYREVHHRTRNLLAVVQSIARQSFGQAPEKVSFLKRLSALSKADNRLSAAVDSVPLVDLLRDELRGFPNEAAVDVDSIVVPRAKVQNLALIVHELATNASKYALTSSVTIEGRELDGNMILRWREDGPPTHQDNNSTGFGLQLINRLVGGMGGHFHIAITDSGMRCEIVLPWRED
jgi:PAS domain S-box-containing protein